VVFIPYKDERKNKIEKLTKKEKWVTHSGNKTSQKKKNHPPGIDNNDI
jgi:hypothetical protein